MTFLRPWVARPKVDRHHTPGWGNFMRALYTVLAWVCLVSCVTPSASIGALPPSIESRWAEITGSDVLLLGELHDNPHHHELQASIIDRLGREGRLGSVHFEHVHTDQQKILDAARADDLESLSQALDWKNSGWPDFALYRPIFAAALQQGAQLVAAHFPTHKMRDLYRLGYSAVFDAEELRTSGLLQPLPEVAQKLLRDEIFEGHCRLIPPTQVESMLPVQRARDAAMALSYRKKSKAGIAVFIVGAGHARKDYGIPWYITRVRPGLKVLSLRMEEEGKIKEQSQGVFDLIVVTPSTERKDPCEQLEKRLKKK
jgi:uncharacterized iron-regulated protein